MTRTIGLLTIVIALAAAEAPLSGNAAVRVEEVARDVEAFLEELNRHEEISLTVMISKDGAPVLEKAYGLANRSFDVPNRIDTKFNLASMNKMFTAVAVMQLVQQGKLNLDDMVGDRIPDYPNDAVRDSVSISQLLTHTAGMGNIFGPLYSQTPVNRFQTVGDYLPLFVDNPLRFSPGSKYEYSNAGYILLGYLIEKITGQDYHAYVKENIFVPAAMQETDFYDVQYPVPNLAVGYSRSKSKSEAYEYKNIEYMKMTKGGPAGGGYSTVGNLTKFGNALFENKLLNKKYTDLTTAGKVAVDDTYEGGEYCFGFLEQVINGHRIVGHSGNLAGIRSTLKIYPDEGITIAILSNFDRGQGAEELEYYIRERINGETEFSRDYLQTKRTIRNVEIEGYASAVKEYDQVRGTFRPYQSLINARGYFLLGKKKYEQAIDLFEFNVFAFPESGIAHDSLAEAYAKSGDNKSAVRHYKKALEIDPNLESATKALKELGAID